MIAIQGHVPISDLTPLKLAKPIGPGDLPPGFADRIKKHLERINNPMTSEERAAQIAKQRAAKVHTVYEANGKVIAVHQRSGGSTFALNSDGRAMAGVYEQATARGLSGDALHDFVADQITAALKEKYGAALTVKTYDNASTAPTSGEVHDRMFGRSSSNASLAAASSRIAYDFDTFALLGGLKSR